MKFCCPSPPHLALRQGHVEALVRPPTAKAPGTSMSRTEHIGNARPQSEQKATPASMNKLRKLKFNSTK